ncbi:hypothetical protein [Pseudobacillus badius]|uniref:hypothetical protein n=1 Tax=Bacillus badius TaxID=1455 RepID=UPI0007B0BA8A|nr:hypothetical protein [Bacillus badius]KZN99563.1 hypothetical protein A4244_16280 [Bacillus badius]MED0665917.1 DUF4083 domain-containing protein [Bacillus badius]OCS85667.1 hypothetical protein A6M11_16295 [Bacillus badius]OVE51979.1 hypothetical protein B1A98_10555 [Bacillus badius]TDW03415.1 hypothetical protein B0G66_104328 [Bacillus badius]
MINVGDVIFQLFSLLIPIGIILLIVQVVRSMKKQDERLRRIEDKVDRMQEESSLSDYKNS